MLVAPETLVRSQARRGRAPQANGGTLLPPLRVQPQLVPGVLVVDIGIAQSLLKMPDQLSRLLIGKAAGKRASLESVAGDKLRLIEPERRDRPRTPHRQFSPEPDRVRTAVVLCRPVHRQFGDRACLRAAAADAAHLARLRRLGADAERRAGAELVSLALIAGLIGLVCGYFIAGALLPDVAASLRGLYGAQIPGHLTLKPQWWIAGVAISILGRARRRRRQPDQGAAAAAARHRPALSPGNRRSGAG